MSEVDSEAKPHRNKFDRITDLMHYVFDSKIDLCRCGMSEGPKPQWSKFDRMTAAGNAILCQLHGGAAKRLLVRESLY